MVSIDVTADLLRRLVRPSSLLHSGLSTLPSTSWEEQVLGDRILVASDDAEEGRYATEVAMRLRAEAGAPLAILRVDGGNAVAGGDASDPAELAAWRHRQPEDATSWITEGVPGIEISRFGDRHRASLIVLGRRDRSEQHVCTLGETSDAVVRRTGVPVLSVPKGVWPFRRTLVALDETPRAHQVLELAIQWSREVALPLRGVTVGGTPPTGRSMPPTTGAFWGPVPIPVTLRQGNPVTEILKEVDATRADILVIGYRRGGPPKVVEATETARRLLLSAECAVLTVPL